MSKGNLFLGQARGKVGDVVFTRVDGEQVARSRNRAPKNPQTPLQMAQRVIQGTVAKAYSMMSGIVDHSFQGRQQGTMNQSRFTELNVAMLRGLVSDALASGDAEDILYSTVCNFNAKGDSLPVINSWKVSEGSLPGTTPIASTGGFAIPLGSIAGEAPTYQEVIDALHANRGDQVTLVVCASDTRAQTDDAGAMTAFRYARIILEPSSGDLSAPFIAGGAVNLPNEKNEGNIALTWRTGVGVEFIVEGVTSASDQYGLGGAAIILSRLEGSVWQRSTAQIVMSTSGGFDLEAKQFGDAVRSYMTEANSSLYLNQANF